MALSRAEFHILLALADGPRHGYGIMQDVEAETGGLVRLGPGTLYSVLKRFLKLRYVEECEPDGDRRRCYRLTRKGKSAVAEEAHYVSAVARVARQRGLLRPA